MRTTISINEDWLFTASQIDPAMPDLSVMETVNLPHTWNAEDGSDGDDFYHRGVCWYAKKIIRPDGECVFLEVEAASQIAEVYLNGTCVGRHQGGFSSFRIDLTETMRPGENLLLISVDNGESEKTYPQFADFTFFGGLYRGVKLIVVPKNHLKLEAGDPGLHVTAELLEDGSASVRTDTGIHTGTRGTFCFTIEDAEGRTVEKNVTEKGEATFTLREPHLWDGVKDPYLYTARVRLEESGDEVAVRFGVRQFSVDAELGFFLNGKPYPLRGVSRHQDRQGKGWAVTEADHRQDIELIREVGANSIRLAHYQHAQYFYDLCDEAGVVVWAEIPFISRFMPGKEAHDDTISQMRELILQCGNHPSICFWGISNEITMKGESEALLQNLNDLQELCHAMDPTRLTTMAQIGAVSLNSPTNTITDVLAYNIYLGWYVGKTEDCADWLDERKHAQPQRALALSEYGADANYEIHSDQPKRKDYSEEYQCLYHEGMLQIIEERPWLWGTYAWNMFEFAADKRNEGGTKGQNTKGFVSYDRTVKKDVFYLYKAYWSKDPFVHVCGRRFVDRVGETTEVKIYSNQSEVTLYCDGEKVGTKNGSRIFRFTIPLAGEHTLRAKAGTCEDTIRIRKVEEPNPDYQVKGGGNEGVDWYLDEYGNRQQLTEKDGYFSVFDPIGMILANPGGAEVIQSLLKQVAAAFTKAGEQQETSKVDENLMEMIKGISPADLIEMSAPKLAGQVLPPLNEMLHRIAK